MNPLIWQQVNDIYVQELGRNADPGGHQAFYDALASGALSIDDVRNQMRGSAEYQQKNAPAPAPPPPPPPPSAPAAPAAPSRNETIWQQVNDIYVQELGRNADPGGQQNLYDQLASGRLSIEGARNALRGSEEYRQKNQSAPATPAAPAYTPFDLNAFGDGQGSDQQMEYYQAAKLANWHMSNGDPNGYAKQFIDQANELKAHLSDPYRIDTVSSENGVETILVTPNGSTPVVQDESGQFVSSITDSGSGDTDSGSNTTGAAINLDFLAQQEESVKNRPYGTGEGQALGFEYGIKNAYGDVYKKYDAQGNLTEYLDKDGVFQKASDVKPVGTQFNPETGQLDTIYEYGGRTGIVGNSYVPGMSPYKEDQGGFLGEGGWSKMAGLVAAGLTAGIAGGAFSSIGLGVPFGATGAAATLVPGSAAAIGTAVSQGALTSIALAGLQGATPAQMLKAGLTGAVSAGISSYLPAAGLTSFEQAAARIGTQTGLAAATGGDVKNALISSVLSAALPAVMNEALPKDVLDSINQLPAPAQKVLMSTLNSTLMAGVQGGDISDAAIGGAINGLKSVAVDFAKGAFKGFTDSDFAKSFSNTFGSSSTAGDFTGSYEDMATTDDDFSTIEQEDDLAAILAKDAQEAIDRNQPVKTDTTTTTTSPVADSNASIVDQFNTNPSAEAFPVADQTNFNLPNLGNDWLIGGGNGELEQDTVNAIERTVGKQGEYSEELNKSLSNTNALLNIVPDSAGFLLGLSKSLYAELEAAQAYLRGSEYNNLTQEQTDEIFKQSQALFSPIRDLIFKATQVDADSPEAKSGLIAQALVEIDKLTSAAAGSVSDATGLNKQYVEGIFGLLGPKVIGKSISSINKLGEGVSAGKWSDAFNNAVTYLEDKNILAPTRNNFIGEGNTLLKYIDDTPSLNTSKLEAFDKGILSANDPVFTLANTYKINPKVAATIIDNSAKLGVPVGTAIGLGLVDSTGNISPAGDTFLNPSPNLGEPQPDFNPEPTPDLEPAPDGEPVTLPEQPANDPVVNPEEPANDPVFVPAEPATPVDPAPDGEPSKPAVPITLPSPDPDVFPDPDAPPAQDPDASPVQDPDASPSPAPSPVTPINPESPFQPDTTAQPKSETDFAAALRTLQERIAVNEAAGMGRDAAFSAAFTDIGDQLGVIGQGVGSTQEGLAGLSNEFGAYQSANAAAAKKAAADKQKQDNSQQLFSLLNQKATGEVKSAPLAAIDYAYDISGDSIFATPKQESLFLSPFEAAPDFVEGALPRYQYFDPKKGYAYADGGFIEDDYSIEDLYRMLGSE